MTVNLTVVAPLIEADLNSLVRHPASRATSELFMPEWTPMEAGLTALKYEQYAHGHAAVVAVNGNGAGEDIIFRARSGSAANPHDGLLYVSVIKGADLANPATWDTLWIAANYLGAGFTDLMYPAWYNNTIAVPQNNGGSIAVVWSGTFFRVFFVQINGWLYYADFNTSGAATTSYMTVADLGITTYQITSMQLAACSYNEVFVLKTQLIEGSLDVIWHKPLYGSMICRYSGNLMAWTASPTTFQFSYQAEAALVRDHQLDYGPNPNEWGSGAAGAIITQWGKRPCGGLAANLLDSTTVVVSAGFTFWKRYGYDTHSQGIISYIYHRDSGQWEKGVEADTSDYVAERLDYALFARGSNIEGNNILVWSRSVEPSDYSQQEASQALPRVREVVYAKFSPDGKALTQHQYLGSQDDLTAATIVAATHAGIKWLYALGWSAVLRSPPASFLCSDPHPAEVGDYCSSYKTTITNRTTMNVDLTLADAGILFEVAPDLKAGRLIRVYAGIPAQQVQIAQGLVDTISPTINLIQETHMAKFVARAEKGLLDPRAEELIEVMPQNTLYIAPDNPTAHIANHLGYWQNVQILWPQTFAGFTPYYNSLYLKRTYRLKSFPYAKTGGPAGSTNNPGQVLNAREQHKGTWFNDAAWTDLSPMVDGAIEASVRFGDVLNAAASFNFYTKDKVRVYGEVISPNTLIETIKWHDGAAGGPIYDTVQQGACMAGLICDAVDMRKKYSFVWEADTTATVNYDAQNTVPAGWIGRPRPFSGSSHTDDTWRAESMDRCDYYPFALGKNKLYLIMSDYDDSVSNWESAGKWIHKVVAGGVDASGPGATSLIPGYPSDLKMIVQGGTIFCFYRRHQIDGAAPYQWIFAFSYKAARFGAGRFGIIGRGHAGVQWDDYYYAYAQVNPLPTGRAIIPKYDNYVDFWDIKVSDCVLDRPMEEVLRRRAWQGFTPTVFNSLVDEPAAQVIASGAIKKYTAPVENLTIDFRVTLSALGGEAGVICRAVDPVTLTGQQHIRMGIVVNGGLPGAGAAVTSYVVKRAYNASGVEIAAAREYSPAVMFLHNTWPLPIRVTVRGRIYTMWIAGNYIGHFVDDTAGGVYFGLYSSGGTSATFTKVYVPELYEVSENSTLEVSQTMYDSIKQTIGKRAIKGVFQPMGALKLSYFEVHDVGPTLHDSLIQAAIHYSDRFISIVRVDGAYTWALYASEVMLRFGRRFVQMSFPDIFHREFCYREGRNLCTRSAEDQVQNTFTGLPDYRVQPEDKIEVIVDQQNIAGHFLVDDISHTFQMGDEPDADSVISTRSFVVI